MVRFDEGARETLASDMGGEGVAHVGPVPGMATDDRQLGAAGGGVGYQIRKARFQVLEPGLSPW